MYVQVPRNSDIPAYVNSLPSFVQDNHAPPEGLMASIGLLIILLTVVLTCLSFIKKSVQFFTGDKPKKTVECTRISVISEADSNTSDMTRFLSIQEFRQHFKELSADSFYKLGLEFDILKTRGMDLMPFLQGERGVNRSKNRFVNVLPFDHTRYTLEPIAGIEGSDYVNANFVSGYHSRREYLATQGPMQNTVDDFWRMCWESGTKCIVMLTLCVDKNREKCYHYWPSCNLPKLYGEVEVEILSERLENFNLMHKWIISELNLRYKDQERRVRHYQFLTWPDFESIEPPEALVYFVREVRKFAPYPSMASGYTPLLIHCSAGVGRTGTFVAVDIAMNQIATTNTVNIPGIINQMRKDRVWMVQTEHQYQSIYKCVIALLDEIEAKKIYASRGIIAPRKMSRLELENTLDVNIEDSSDE